jgi:hypothetical protein
MTSELPERRSGEGHAPGTRASDAEREQIAERLREAVAEGRLDMEEFDERLSGSPTPPVRTASWCRW